MARRTGRVDLQPRKEFVHLIPNVRPAEMTATGLIEYKQAVALMMPARFAMAYGRELAALTSGQKMHFKSTFVARLPESKTKGTFENYLASMLVSIVRMNAKQRLFFLGELCDFINEKQDATGLESILTSTIESIWPLCCDELAQYAVQTWLEYVPTGGISATSGLSVVNGITGRVEVFDAAEVPALALERNVARTPNGANGKFDRYGRSRGGGRTGPRGRGAIEQWVDDPSRPDGQWHGSGQGSGYGPGGGKRDGRDAMPGGFADSSRPGDEWRGPGQGSGYGLDSGKHDGRDAMPSDFADPSRPGDEWRGPGQGSDYGQPGRQSASGALDQFGMGFGQPGGFQQDSAGLGGPFGRGRSPKDQRTTDNSENAWSLILSGAIVGAAGAVGGAIAGGGIAIGVAAAGGIAVTAGLAWLTVETIEKHNQEEMPKAELPVVTDKPPPEDPKKDQKPDPNEPNQQHRPNPDDTDPGSPNAYYPVPDSDGDGGPNSIVSFPSSVDYYPDPNSGDGVGPRAANVRLVQVGFATGPGISSTVRALGPKTFRISP